ncbi:MAG: allophanate hydrolase subunit 1 [Bacteroidota bacterium]
MRQEEHKSLQINDENWGLKTLGSAVYLLQAPSKITIHQIHRITNAIVEALSDQLIDIVPAYDSIALFTSLRKKQLKSILEGLTIFPEKQTTQSPPKMIPICYEMGIDLERISRHTKLPLEELIALHLQGNYTVDLIGFTPGFIYAGGLSPVLACPRLSEPRVNVEAGSIGIGGDQTGIYSLKSPGGWNIIGRTPLKLFDFEKSPPLSLALGSQFQFQRISKNDFESWVK